MNELLDTALAYLERGWSVIPITPGQKAPPLVKWEEYQKRRPTIEEVEQWFTTWQDANVAIVTGAISGITVVDLDGPTGIQTAREHLFEGKITTRKHRTPKGFHVFFQYTSQFHTGAGFLDGVDIRNDGGYVLAPPSQVDTKLYTVAEDSPLAVIPFGPAAFDVPVVVPFRPRETSQGWKEEQPTWVSEALNGVPEDYRNDTATRLIGYFHSLGMPKDIIFEVLTPFAEKCRPPMDLRELERSIESVTRYQSQAGHLGVIDPPALERKGGMYIYRWPALGTNFTFDEVAITKDGKHAELTIHAEQPGVSTLHYGPVHLNLASTQAHNSLARYLTGRLALENWPVLIEQACNLTILAEKQGEPLVDLRERPLVKLEKYLLYPLILDNLPVILFGDGGTGKSLLALALQLTLETGAKSILDITPNRRVKGLLLDWEFDQRFHQERYEAIRNGAFLTESMENIIGYRRCYLPLEQELSVIHKMVDEEGFGFLVIDSAAAACGGEPEKTGPAMSFFNALRKLNMSSLIVAHQTKDTEKSDKPFGSSFWWNMARMVWKAEKVQDANDSMLAIGLYNKKNNVDKLHAPLSYYVNFSEGSISFHQEDIFATEELAEKLPTWERIREELQRGAKGTKDILEALGIPPKERSKVDTALTRGRRGNKWTQNMDGLWELL